MVSLREVSQHGELGAHALTLLDRLGEGGVLLDQGFFQHRLGKVEKNENSILLLHICTGIYILAIPPLGRGILSKLKN